MWESHGRSPGKSCVFKYIYIYTYNIYIYIYLKNIIYIYILRYNIHNIYYIYICYCTYKNPDAVSMVLEYESLHSKKNISMINSLVGKHSSTMEHLENGGFSRSMIVYNVVEHGKTITMTVAV